MGTGAVMQRRKILKGSTKAFCIDGDVMVLECQLIGSVWMESAPARPAFDCASLIIFVLTCPFCCMTSGQVLVCHAHIHMITCDDLYSLAVLQTGFI
jgi:hypothetical protein